MSQKLILPINELKITAGYMNSKYKLRFGFSHYGIDAISTASVRYVYALGEGMVVAAGQDGASLTGSDSRMGNAVVIIYRDVLCNDGILRDLVCRMFHFDRLMCSAGDQVSAGTRIGMYGSTGAYVTGAHLHLEFDADTKYPQYAYGVASGGAIIKRGTINSTVNPSHIWFIGKNQSISRTLDGYTTDADETIPRKKDEEEDFDDNSRTKTENAELKEQNEELKAAIQSMKEDIAGLAGKYA